MNCNCGCGNPIKPSTRGKPRLYFSDKCRRKAKYQRKKTLHEAVFRILSVFAR